MTGETEFLSVPFGFPLSSTVADRGYDWDLFTSTRIDSAVVEITGPPDATAHFEYLRVEVYNGAVEPVLIAHMEEARSGSEALLVIDEAAPGEAILEHPTLYYVLYVRPNERVLTGVEYAIRVRTWHWYGVEFDAP